jgi:hypothetical protein
VVVAVAMPLVFRQQAVLEAAVLEETTAPALMARQTLVVAVVVVVTTPALAYKLAVPVAPALSS